MTETITPFIMHGAREAITSGLLHIEEQVKGLERAIDENPGLAFDLAKTLIESTCRTILSERSVVFSPGDDLPKLFKEAAKDLSFLPPSVPDESVVDKSLKKTLNGLNTALQGICELRNNCGFASHGSDSPRPVLEGVQALLAAQAADAIVGFLHRIHRQDRVVSISLRTEYDSNPDFNDSVDETHGLIQIFDAEFKPSEILFRLEPETYRVYLAEYIPEIFTMEPDVNESLGEL